jgi:hypothetical protein
VFALCFRSCLVSYAHMSTDAECISCVYVVGEEA